MVISFSGALAGLSQTKQEDANEKQQWGPGSGTPVPKPAVSLTSAVAQRGTTLPVFAPRLTVSCLVLYLIPNRKASVCLLFYDHHCRWTRGQGKLQKKRTDARKRAMALEGHGSPSRRAERQVLHNSVARAPHSAWMTASVPGKGTCVSREPQRPSRSQSVTRSTENENPLSGQVCVCVLTQQVVKGIFRRLLCLRAYFSLGRGSSPLFPKGSPYRGALGSIPAVISEVKPNKTFKQVSKV